MGKCCSCSKKLDEETGGDDIQLSDIKKPEKLEARMDIEGPDHKAPDHSDDPTYRSHHDTGKNDPENAGTSGLFNFRSGDDKAFGFKSDETAFGTIAKDKPIRRPLNQS